MSDTIVIESTAHGFNLEHAKLTQIEEVIRDFHLALDLREHGGTAGWRALEKIQQIVDMPWVQGAEELKRREGKK